MSASRPPDPGPLLGESSAMAGVRDFLERAAPVSVPVLLEGETGTGKSHLARLLHLRGPRRREPFVSVNCAGVPDALFEAEFFGHRRGAFTGASESRPGLFEQASGGTLFLDEVGELPIHQQAKLLAVLEEGRVRRVGGTRVREVDVRLVAATCRRLDEAVAQGEFRTDLYHRLALLRCEVPPLRRRPTDLDRLIDHFMSRIAERHDVPAPDLELGVREVLRGHAWPGNVRELAHLLEAALILAGGRTLGRDLVLRLLRSTPAGSAAARERGPRRAQRTSPPASTEAAPASSVRRRYSFYGSPEEEEETIRRALARHRGNRTRAARELGMSRNTLRHRMRKYGI